VNDSRPRRQLDGTGLKRLHRSWRDRTSGRVALVLDGLGTPVNVGSIVRTAAALRIDHLWVAGATVDLDHPGAGRTAMGTDRYLEWVRVDTGADAVQAARAAGYDCVALELTEDAVALHDLVGEIGPDVCLVVGHEDHGVSKAALSAVDHVAYLPQVGKVGSLNVAIAASIGMYELRRRGWTGDR
jgi:tRNA (guanosine-2'-O-)-methyltransferase